MKQYIAATALCLMAASPIFAQQTRRIMTVTTKNGQTVEYKVNSVQNVTFTNQTLEALKNQVAFGKELTYIDKVTMLQTEDAYVFNLYAAAGETETQSEAAATPVLTITMPQALMGEELTFGTDEAKGVKVAYNGEEQTLAGTVQARFNKSNVIITLEAETPDYTDLRCKWNKTYSQVYEASNTIKVTNVSEIGTFNVASALVLNPSTTGAATTFGFGDATATDAKGLLEGKVGVQLGITASKLYNGTINMVDDADSYTFKYIDYATRIVYDKVKSGIITTAKDNDGNVYVKINATMDDNRTIELEYYGATTEVESLDDMIPAAVDEKKNEFRFYNADGDVTETKEIVNAYIDASSTYTILYLCHDGVSKFSSQRYELKIDEKWFNAGEINLGEMNSTDLFKFKCSYWTLYSEAECHQWGNVPTNGTFTATRDDAGNYEVTLEVTNKYNNPGMHYENKGDNTKVVLHYKGTAEKY